MKLEIAQEVAKSIIKLLEPYCSKIQVAGSVRRKKLECRDIDIVLIPEDHWGLNAALGRIGKQQKGGDKMRQFITAGGHQVDIYFATEETWATLLLIRTGSRTHNIQLCSLARGAGWKLCANGGGLFNENGERIAGDTEESIYQKLMLGYIPPERRG